MDKDKLNNEEELETVEETVEETEEAVEVAEVEEATEALEETEAKELWKCAECESVNEGDSCLVCGAERPEDAEIVTDYEYVDSDTDSSNNVMANVEIVDEDEAGDEPKKGLSKNATIGIAVGAVAVVVLLILTILSNLGVIKKKVKYNDIYNQMYVDVQGKTLAEIADESGYTVEEYKKLNGLPEDMGPDTNSNAVSNSTPMRIVVKRSGMDFASFKEYYGWDETITEDSTVGEALGATKLRVIIGANSMGDEAAQRALAQFKDFYGFGDEITLDTLYGEVRTKIDEKAREERIEQEKAAEEAAKATPTPVPTEAPAPEVTEAPVATEVPAQ